ncbi:pyridoxamine 5'-phosphate oxidase [Kerstersia sp.]|uniref:pyridoxamine 5'-phosphate oxidase n=1 Tax=Kerstersia sp. TaxID=1930783 RepID=UPI003F8E0B5E
MSLADLRQTYSRDTLLEQDLAPTPLEQFQHWFQAAQQGEVAEPNAMTLATADADGKPDARIVLIKGADERGFIFFTNRDSRKGQEMAAQQHACLLFFWQALQRQVRIEGRIEWLPDAESDAYYHSRPLDSRLGAWASRQSATTTRAELEAAFEAARAKYGEEPPRPPHWGGYLVRPEAVEFWQGRPSRLHDRLRYERQADGQWLIRRLAP